MQLTGRTALLAPAAVDFGHATAIELARHGAQVVLIDEASAWLDDIAADVVKLGGKCTIFHGDAADPDALAAASARCADAVDALDILVSCHLRPAFSTFEDTSVESWRKMIDYNLLGPVFLVKAFLPLLKKSASSSIIFVSSFDGIQGNPTVPTYSTAKGGIAPFTHVLASEVAKYGIRVNAIAKGMTCEAEFDDDPYYKPLYEHTPLGRPARPGEVASTVRFLASDDAGYFTGSVLVMDGGRTGITPGTRSLPIHSPPSDYPLTR